MATTTNGVTRHITRAPPAPAILSAPTTTHGFPYVLKCFQGSVPVHATIVDTVVLAGGAPATWYFTSRSGAVLKKTPSNTTLPKLQAAFASFAAQYPKGCATYAVTYAGEPPMPSAITPAAFPALLTSGFGGAAAVQPAAPSSASSTSHANFCHEYSVFKGASDGRPVLSAFRYSRGLPSTKNRVVSGVAHVNAAMDRDVLAVVGAVQAARGVRVAHMVTEFSQDANGKLWLVAVTRVDVAKVAPAPSAAVKAVRDAEVTRPASPDVFGPTHVVARKGVKGTGGDTATERRERLALGLPPAAGPPPTLTSSTDVQQVLGSSQAPAAACAGDYCSATLPTHAPSNAPTQASNTTVLSSVLDPTELAALRDGPATSPATPQAPTSVVSFRVVAQARADAAAVKNLLAGGSGVGLAAALSSSTSQLRASQAFPASYYRDVAVCPRCAAVYRFVEAARKRRAAKARKGKRRAVSLHDGRVPPQVLPDAGPPTATVSAWDDPDFDVFQDPAKVAAERALATAAARSAAALQRLTAADVSELRSFTHPPPAVQLVTTALMVLLKGEALDWHASRRALSNGDKVVDGIVRLDAAAVPRRRLATLLPLVSNPAFHPSNLRPVSAAAAAVGEWVLATVMHAAVASGVTPPDEASLPRLPTPPAPTSRSSSLRSSSSTAAALRSGTAAATTAAATPSFADKLKARRAAADASRRRTAPGPAASRRRGGTAARSRAAKTRAQKAAAARLTSFKEPTPGTFTTSPRLGSTLPYVVMGTPPAGDGGGHHSFVVVHDLFDTYESTQIMLRHLVARSHAQVLLMNLPGQAYTTYPEADVPLNATFHAAVLDELLASVNASGEFPAASVPFHLVGVGNGAMVAATYAVNHGSRFRDTLASLVPVNGFARVDSQLAAVLHSSVNVFSCFPPDRPDLPVAYFAKFLFSEAYVGKVTNDTALSMYTAVTNPITLDGRLRLARGALNHGDARAAVKALTLPVVVVQSTADMLVAASNADAFLEGRSTRHVWSHEHGVQKPAAVPEGATSTTGPNVMLGPRSVGHLQEVLRGRGSALAVWLEAGHEVRQEARKQLLQLLYVLADPIAAEDDAAEGVTVTAAGNTLGPKSGGKRRPKHVDPLKAPYPEVASSPVRAKLMGRRPPEPAAPKPAAPAQAPEDDSRVALASALAEARAVVDKGVGRDTPGVVLDKLLKVEGKEGEGKEAAGEGKEGGLEDGGAVEDSLETRLASLREEQENRRKKWAEEDAARLARLEEVAKLRQEQRDAETSTLLQHLKALDEEGAARRARLLEGPEDEEDGGEGGAVVDGGAAAAAQPRRRSVSKLAPEPHPGFDAVFEDLEAKEAEERRLHLLSIKQYETVKTVVADRAADTEAARAAEAEAKAASELEEQSSHAVKIQAGARGLVARRRVARLQADRDAADRRRKAAVGIQAAARGRAARKYATSVKEQQEQEAAYGYSALNIQRVFRGHKGRRRARAKRCAIAARCIQRVARGYLGRLAADAKREAAREAAAKETAAVTIQSAWRMHSTMEGYRSLQILQLAAVQIQRTWRGWLGRQRAARRRAWEEAAPGPERLQLGIKLIEGSKEAFERQKQEIDALHRAQERAEARVGTIHAGLKDSEAELANIQRELKGIDTLDAELRDLAHDKQRVEEDIKAAKDEQEAAAAMSQGGRRRRSSVAGRRASIGHMEAERRRLDEAHKLEMAIRRKQDEREAKKKELEAEFAGVFAEVASKKDELSRLERNIDDMEAMRQRKDREFSRLQRNLMELLAEQKAELDSLREKGVQLEAATATSAAAAAATATAAKENQMRSNQMFQSTEELLKFQFMSMSMSYFSSLNMLSNLREINADTTNAAVTSSADTAAAAAAAAAAASIPQMHHMKLGSQDLLDAAEARKRITEAEKLRRLEDAKKLITEPFPPDIRKWRVADVCRWLDTLSLGQYKKAFQEAAIDGDFLLELRPEDIRDVLGVEHQLHVRKICTSRDKLRPLTDAERRKLAAVEAEESAAAARGERLTLAGGQVVDPLSSASRAAIVGGPAAAEGSSGAPPDPSIAFSQVRHNRYKRLVESLNAGVSVHHEDEHGNTMLLIAAQNVNKKTCELLLERGANINHTNKQGNTPLHFAMMYDPAGALGEWLIDRGADDSLVNAEGLNCYDVM